MSGHSKWASIKHKKGAADSKRGKLFSKIIRELTVVARQGGGDPATNARLRTVIATAKTSNMPSDNIDKAIKRGTGELPGVTYEAIIYEAYAPGGVAILVDVLTDNKNRTSAEVRNLLSKKNGNMSGAGSVSWQFHRKGFISVDKDKADENNLFNLVIEAGAEDFKVETDAFEITSTPENFETVKNAVTQNNIEISLAEITSLPSTTVKITDEATARKILDLVEILEDHDDVQHVYANFDIPDEIIQQAAS